MRALIAALCVATAFVAAPVTLNAEETRPAPTWWRTVILPEKNPSCVVVEGNLYCPSGTPTMIVTYEPVTDEETLRKIRNAGRVSALETDRDD